MNKGLLAIAVVLIFETIAYACPACSVSNAQRNTWQTFWILSVMGFLPLVIALIVGIWISKINKYDKTKITQP